MLKFKCILVFALGFWSVFGHLTVVGRHILDCLEFKEVTDNDFKCGKHGGRFIDSIKMKKNIEWNGEIARDEQFLFFSLNIFSKICIVLTSDD